MALSDPIRDQLLTLQVAATALASYAEAAAANANSDSVQTDPMMRSVRAGFLTLSGIGQNFLSIDRPDSGGPRFAGSAINAAVDASSASASAKTAIKAKFNGTATYSNAQIQNRFYEFVVAGALTTNMLTGIETELGSGAVVNPSD